jgi:DNA-binding SARP family transcriptional activator
LLYIELLGRVHVSIGSDRRPLKLTRQCATELAYFAATRGQLHSREHLIERFWPEEETNRGRANLSSAIWRLQRTLRGGAAPSLSVNSMGDIGFERNAPIWLDSESFERAFGPAFASPRGPLDKAELGDIVKALELYRGEYMPGWYDDWVLTQRERLHALRFRGKLRLLEHYEAMDELEDAIDCGHELLRMDALRETVHRGLMRIYAKKGEPARIVTQYRMLERMLKSELGVRPSAQTEALYRDLIAPVPAERSVPAPAIPSRL